MGHSCPCCYSELRYRSIMMTMFWWVNWPMSAQITQCFSQPFIIPKQLVAQSWCSSRVFNRKVLNLCCHKKKILVTFFLQTNICSRVETWKLNRECFFRWKFNNKSKMNYYPMNLLKLMYIYKDYILLVIIAIAMVFIYRMHGQ